MKSVEAARRVQDYPGTEAAQLPADAGGTRPAVSGHMPTMVLLRDARITGETTVAVDHLLQLGYAPDRAERAAQPYADPVTRAYRLLSLSDQEAAAQAASDVAVERRLARASRPLAWAYLQIAIAADIADATRDRLEEYCSCGTPLHEPGQNVDIACALHASKLTRAAEAHRLLEAATDRARSLWQGSDEVREYEFGGESLGGGRERGHNHAPSRVETALTEWTRSGDWEENDRTFWICDRAWPIDPVTNEEIDEDRVDVRVAFEPAEPACDVVLGHDWKSPHSVLGGLEDNPGVWGKGGGVVIREVCLHCGVYRVTDTWAQDRSTGVQGLESVTYEDADDDSLEWVAARRASRRRNQIIDACREVEGDAEHDHLPRYLDGRGEDLERVSDDEWRIVRVGSVETTDGNFDELVRLLADKLGSGWRIAWEHDAEGEGTITLELRA